MPSSPNRQRTIVIIGASGGIGSVAAKAFSEVGDNVVLSARDRAKLEVTAASFDPARTLVAPADASYPEEVEALFALAVAKFGSVDGVVISAGSWKQLSMHEPLEDAVSLAKKHFEALFLPTFTVAYEAQRIFREQGHGLIVNISSHAAYKPELRKNLTYGPMKAAARHFMLALSHELNGTGVRVTDIAPAIVNTPDNAAFLDTKDKRAKAVQPRAIAYWIVENFDNPKIPLTKNFESGVTI